jgi:hypothetical protein
MTPQPLIDFIASMAALAGVAAAVSLGLYLALAAVMNWEN